MSGNRRYVLDANVFIEAHQKYYGFDICTGFWLSLIRQHGQKRILSIDKVKAELTAGDDLLARWTNDTAPDSFFKGTADKKVADAFARLMNWVQAEKQFLSNAKAQFASTADGWVVAYAKTNGLVVVTHEEYAPEAKKKVPIPNLCVEFEVNYCNTFEMLRELGVQFVLRKKLTK